MMSYCFVKSPTCVFQVRAVTHPIHPALYFYDQAGAPIAAESVVDVLGDLVVREDAL